MLLPHPAGTERVFASIWFTVLSSEALLFTISIAFILMAMAKERAAFIHKAAALLDPLTGVWNRRGLLAENERLFQQFRKRAQEVAVLLVDLDNFKSINDRFGHAFGDRVLQMFAATARSAVRGSDFVGRLGGEEFAVVLHGHAGERAMAVAERIRNAFAGGGDRGRESRCNRQHGVGASRRLDDGLYRAAVEGRPRALPGQGRRAQSRRMGGVGFLCTRPGWQAPVRCGAAGGAKRRLTMRVVANAQFGPRRLFTTGRPEPKGGAMPAG
jgi:diguanylate cyclase (GGDEF)-like protein